MNEQKIRKHASIAIVFSVIFASFLFPLGIPFWVDECNFFEGGSIADSFMIEFALYAIYTLATLGFIVSAIRKSQRLLTLSGRVMIVLGITFVLLSVC